MQCRRVGGRADSRIGRRAGSRMRHQAEPGSYLHAASAAVVLLPGAGGPWPAGPGGEPVTTCPAVPSTTRTLASPLTCCTAAPGSTFRTSRAAAAIPGGYSMTVWATSLLDQVRPAPCTRKPSPDSCLPVLADSPPISVPLYTSTETWLR